MLKDELIKRFEGKAFQTDRRSTPYGDILVAERFVATEDMHTVGDPTVTEDEFPNGVYQQWWVVCRGENVDGYGTMYYDALHDLESMALHERKTARDNSAVELAQRFIRDNVESGRYGRH